MFLTPQEYFRQRGTRPRKRFGQHFLAQPGTAERIVKSADLQASDVAVEVGPGLGALTRFILPRVWKLHLVELDRDLAFHLESMALQPGGRATIHQMDILEFDFRGLSSAENQRLVVLGNLPYNVTSPLGFRLLESFPAIRRSVFMVQREVGERWTASPGGKEYGVLSVLFGIYGKVIPLFLVGPHQFYPPPKVDSLVLQVDFRDSPPAGAPPFEFLRRLVSSAFQQRRKTLQNCLKSFVEGNKEDLEKAFEKTGVHPGRRPETLSPEEFLELSKAIFTAGT